MKHTVGAIPAMTAAGNYPKALEGEKKLDYTLHATDSAILRKSHPYAHARALGAKTFWNDFFSFFSKILFCRHHRTVRCSFVHSSSSTWPFVRQSRAPWSFAAAAAIRPFSQSCRQRENLMHQVYGVKNWISPLSSLSPPRAHGTSRSGGAGSGGDPKHSLCTAR